MGRHEAARVVRYIFPAVLLLSFVLFLLAASWRSSVSSRRRRPARFARCTTAFKFLCLGLALTYIGQAVVLGLAALGCYGSSCPPLQDEVVYIVSSIVSWILIAGQGALLWRSRAALALIGGAGEVVLAVLEPPTIAEDPDRAAKFGLRIIRLVLLLSLLVLSATTISLTKAFENVEAEPLLGGLSDDRGVQLDDMSSDDSEVDDFKNNEAMVRRKKARMRASGSWWAYIKPFKIFLPMLSPRGNRQVQLCMAVSIFCLVVNRLLNLLIPRQLGIITDKLSKSLGNRAPPYGELGIWMLFHIVASSAGVRLLGSIAKVRIGRFAYCRLSKAAFDQVMKLSIDYHDGKDSAATRTALYQGLVLRNALEFVFLNVLPTFVDLVVALCYFGYLFDACVSLTVFGAGICYFCVEAKTTHMIRPVRRQCVKEMIKENKVMNQAVKNWRTVYYFNRFDHEKSNFEAAVDAHQAALQEYEVKTSIYRSLAELIATFAYFIVSVLVIVLISRGRAPIGHFVVLLTYWAVLWNPLSSIMSYYGSINQYLIDAENLLFIFQSKPDVEEDPGAKPLKISAGKVEFQQVSFAYDGRRPVLKNVNLCVEGHTLAIVGETGAGKSTLFKILYRLYDVGGGCVTIDGQDIRRVTLDSLRDAIGIVPQDPVLFNTTIMENVRYGRLDASDVDVQEACHAAAIHCKILTFPDGYNSRVGDDGVKLSGGELQRIAIARCLLKNPYILLLDEATSHIDSETEDLIHKALATLTIRRTTFVIAHRLSTVVHARQIIVLHEGEVAESGTHEELLRKGGKYYRLWSKQMSIMSDNSASGILQGPASPKFAATSRYSSGETAIAAESYKDAHEMGNRETIDDFARAGTNSETSSSTAILSGKGVEARLSSAEDCVEDRYGALDHSSAAQAEGTETEEINKDKAKATGDEPLEGGHEPSMHPSQ